jgi:rhamnogalacturonan endolyase
MSFLFCAAGAGSAPLPAPLNEAPGDSASIDNPYVRVYHNIAACGAANPSGFGTRVIVALTTLGIQSSRGDLKLQRGQIAVFRSNESYSPPRGEFFEVAFKSNHPPAKGPEKWIEPTKNTIVYEDEEFRVFEERLAGGDERPLHSHAQRIVVRLNEVQLTDPRFYKVPPPGSGIQVPNTVRFAEPMVHAVKNTSKDSLFNIVIEFKVPKSDANEQLLFSDDFKKGAAQWIAEFEDSVGSSVVMRRGVLDLKASAGATVWFKNKLSGNILITYDVTMIDSGGATDRVSDLNAFWMAQDPVRSVPFGRNGKFPSYDDLHLYYAGIGGNNNTTTRFRRYDPEKGKPVLKEYLDKEHLLEGNKYYVVKITVQNGRTTLSVNDLLYFDYTDKRPLTEGYFGFRTTKSHQRISNFRVYRLE